MSDDQKIKEDPSDKLSIKNPTPKDIAKILADAFKTIDLALYMIHNGEDKNAKLVLSMWINLHTPKLRNFDLVEQLLTEVWGEPRPKPSDGVSPELQKLVDKVPRFNADRLARGRVTTVRDLRLVAQVPGEWSNFPGIGWDSLKRIREVLEEYYKEDIETVDLKQVMDQIAYYEQRSEEDGRESDGD